MRIISGNNKGKKLFAPKDMSVRPTSDKIKESIFNIIGPIYEDDVILDLFAGTGNVGLEFLCRGAEKCYFIDVSSKSLNFVKKNISLCNLEDKSEVILNDYEKAIKYFGSLGKEFDYIFADAPYALNCANRVVELICENKILKKTGVIIIECEKSEKMFEKLSQSMVKYKEKIYGSTKIGFFRFLEE